MKNNKVFLYSGLTLLFVAFIGNWLGIPGALFWSLFAVAVMLKVIFLIGIFRQKRKYSKLGLYLILSGVAMILLSFLFKTLYPLPLLRNILFYGAISLKVSGLVLLITKKQAQKIST